MELQEYKWKIPKYWISVIITGKLAKHFRCSEPNQNIPLVIFTLTYRLDWCEICGIVVFAGCINGLGTGIGAGAHFTSLVIVLYRNIIRSN